MGMSFDEVCRRASGRRHYNAVRRFTAAMRLGQVARLMNAGLTQRAIAGELHLHPATISRDCKRLHLLWGRWLPLDRVARMTVHEVDQASYTDWFKTIH